MSSSFFRSTDGAWRNIAALTYTIVGYVCGLAFILADAWWVNIIGVLLLTHALVYAAYFLHEFAHGTIFNTNRANRRGGEAMSWLTGAAYAPFVDLRRKHMRHHVDRADVVTFDYKAFLRHRPAWVCSLVSALEWLYIPAVEFLMRGYVILVPFISPECKSNRTRILGVLSVRLVFFAALGWVAPKSLFLYFVAYVIFVTILRFVDAYQHTYDAFAVLASSGEIPKDKVRDRSYEQLNTYTNLVSLSYPWLNLLLLNFCYHNAHHEKPKIPWHQLPVLHRELFGNNDQQVLPMSMLIKGFHRNRVRRVLSEDYGAVTTGDNKAEGFYGAVGVSFLTAV
ncbi:fatty acid desaturase family protein [Acidithiobacillus ferriphilus]|jgi:fatty acid desaturase|uniref:fatty acid desaturase family protein n=1 Tax=Acidithiobacillus ferriphilus TaxID=1689834 RepID=UPI001C07672C|nr:fatty acid desaturase [Acidithiobacillus ferriphilus]MBU2854693.1 fatty acid desaturase [Acidithiobacillus ferriphilus]